MADVDNTHVTCDTFAVSDAPPVVSTAREFAIFYTACKAVAHDDFHVFALPSESPRSLLTRRRRAPSLRVCRIVRTSILMLVTLCQVPEVAELTVYFLCDDGKNRKKTCEEASALCYVLCIPRTAPTSLPGSSPRAHCSGAGRERVERDL